MIKTKVITDSSDSDFQKAVNDFIADKHVLDIKYRDGARLL